MEAGIGPAVTNPPGGGCVPPPRRGDGIGERTRYGSRTAGNARGACFSIPGIPISTSLMPPRSKTARTASRLAIFRRSASSTSTRSVGSGIRRRISSYFRLTSPKVGQARGTIVNRRAAERRQHRRLPARKGAIAPPHHTPTAAESRTVAAVAEVEVALATPALSGGRGAGLENPQDAMEHATVADAGSAR